MLADGQLALSRGAVFMESVNINRVFKKEGILLQLQHHSFKADFLRDLLPELSEYTSVT